MEIIFYAVLMGAIAAAPIGLMGVASALAAMQHRLANAIKLASGVILADAVVITTCNAVLVSFPGQGWAAIQGMPFLWWGMAVGLAAYGVWLLTQKPEKSRALLYPGSPFLFSLRWTLTVNAKNWIGMGVLYTGWHTLGLTPTITAQAVVGGSAWVGGIATWAMWLGICWRAKAWHAQAEQMAHVLAGVLCLLGAFLAALQLSTS